MKKGIDVSKWQGIIDWQKVKAAGIEFAIIRAGYGRLPQYKDATFELNYAGAKAAGIHLGAYHYSYADSTAKAKQEGELFLSWLKGRQFEYPVVLDLEADSLIKLGKKVLTEIADRFLSTVESAGYYVALYSNRHWLNNLLDSNYLLKKYDLWLAHWTKSGKPDMDLSGECGLWQYSSSGRVEGIKGNVDLNIAYRDYPVIIRKSGLNGFAGDGGKAPKNSMNQGEVKVFLRVIRFGTKGEDVGQVQRFLKNLGYYKGPIDNEFGPGQGLLKAVEAFQKAEKLQVDGVVGPETQARITEILLEEQGSNIENKAKLIEVKNLANKIIELL
ncbi:MAG: GH25 family lysozyme [Caldicoprobacterales bacterium]|nr:1,4-beta-N-acetylmuramidase [Clostridiales bacterium]